LIRSEASSKKSCFNLFLLFWGVPNYQAKLYGKKSRLQAIARAHGLVCIPEGVASLKSQEIVPVQLLAPRLEGMGVGSDSIGKQQRP